VSPPQNRELQIMGIMDHCDVISLKHCFYSKGEKVSLFLILDGPLRGS